jgi:hypothetical protein
VNGFRGDLNVDTGSGSVRVNDVNGPSVRLDTGSGGVTGDAIVTDDLLVDTGSGSVELSRVDAKRAKVDTGSGGVEVGLLTDTPDLDIDTGSGSVRVSVPTSLSARLHIETGSGGIRSELPMTIDEKDTGILRGTVGSGTGRLHVDTGSGGVSLLAVNTPAPGRARRSRSERALVAAAPAPVREPPRLVNLLAINRVKSERIRTIPQGRSQGNGFARKTGTSGARAREVRRATRDLP